MKMACLWIVPATVLALLPVQPAAARQKVTITAKDCKRLVRHAPSAGAAAVGRR